jgi:hypothetical protein
MGINYKKDTTKGHYKVLHPEKYLGNKPTIYKSKWELQVFHALDVNPYVLKWGYECIEIYYHHPLYMNMTVYYPDIFCHVKMDSGVVKQFLVEIKPQKYVEMPTKPTPPKNKSAQTAQSAEKYRKRMLKYQSDVRDFMVNTAKWEAAEKWCLKNNVKWRILTEKNTTNLFG